MGAGILGVGVLPTHGALFGQRPPSLASEHPLESRNSQCSHLATTNPIRDMSRRVATCCDACQVINYMTEMGTVGSFKNVTEPRECFLILVICESPPGSRPSGVQGRCDGLAPK